MPRHQEISTITELDIVSDYALFAYDISSRRGARRLRTPISVAESGNSIVAISQLMISLEGYVNRVLHLLEDEDPATYAGALDLRWIHERLGAVLGDSRAARNVLHRVQEASVVRNAIMHAHLYQTERDQNRRIKSVQKRILDSNRTYANYVNTSTYRTKTSLYHVIPSEIGFDDVLKFLKLWKRVYRFIERKHQNKAYLAPYYPYGYIRYLKSKSRDTEVDQIRLDNNGSFERLISYFDDHLALNRNASI